MAATKVKIVGVEKKRGYHYFLDKDGDVSSFSRGETRKVAEAGVKKERGYYYFIDNDGDISRARMARGGALAKGAKT